jgi:hypothetical protein
MLPNANRPKSTPVETREVAGLDCGWLQHVDESFGISNTGQVVEHHVRLRSVEYQCTKPPKLVLSVHVTCTAGAVQPVVRSGRGNRVAMHRVDDVDPIGARCASGCLRSPPIECRLYVSAGLRSLGCIGGWLHLLQQQPPVGQLGPDCGDVRIAGR